MDLEGEGGWEREIDRHDYFMACMFLAVDPPHILCRPRSH